MPHCVAIVLRGQTDVGSAVRLRGFRCGHGVSPSFRLALRSIPITETSSLLRPLLTPARRPNGRFRPPRRRLRKRSPPADAGQVSPDKVHELPLHNRRIYVSLLPVGLRHVVLARPWVAPCMRFLFVGSQVLPPASFPRRLTASQLPSAHSFIYWPPVGDLNPISSRPCWAYTSGRTVRAAARP